MKHIIFEAIYSILLSKNFPITFDYDVVTHLVESMNLYGMSIDKFKRLLKMLLTDYFYTNPLYFVHTTDL